MFCVLVSVRGGGEEDMTHSFAWDMAGYTACSTAGWRGHHAAGGCWALFEARPQALQPTVPGRAIIARTATARTLLASRPPPASSAVCSSLLALANFLCLVALDAAAHRRLAP